MKTIILCAGYATRLYPLTENFPKQLLKIGERPLIEYIIGKINKIKDVDEIIIVSNNKYYDKFNNWRQGFKSKIPVNIINDGSTDNGNRLGAVKDILFAIDSLNIDDELLVLAGDNLIEFSLSDFYHKFKELDENLIAVYDIKDFEKVRGRHGVVLLDDGKVVDFQEKPENPKSTIKSICCYLFKSGTKNLIREYLENGNPDATGFFIEWLVKRISVHAFQFSEKIYDIGNLESYEEVKRVFGPKT